MKDTVFHQLLVPLSDNLIQECIKRFRSDYYYETMNTQTHLKAMIYAQINESKSLRLLETTINSQNIGIEVKIKRSTLSDANAKRNADCFFWLLDQLMSLLPRTIRKEVKKVVKLLDSSPIKLRGRGYDEWAEEVSTRHWQGIKLHVEYDLELGAPTTIKTSFANFNDSSMGQRWVINKDTIYVFDKGYCDFNWWWSIDQKNAFFVTRLKKNTAILMQSEEKISSETILEDGTFVLKNKNPRGGKKNYYTEPLRRISVFREGKKPLILVTNIKDLSPEVIANLYKSRWDIELFFKWIKQNLKLKKFLGKSANAVKIQMATALITYILLFIFKSNSNDKRTLQLITAYVRVNLTRRKCYLRVTSPPVYYFPLRPLISKGRAVYL